MAGTDGETFTEAGLRIFDGDDGEVWLDPHEAVTLLEIAGGLEDATVSACRFCASRVLAASAFSDLLARSAPHPRERDLVELADDAPTAHLYVADERRPCTHRGWLDPGHAEWVEMTR
jgi:hypothetical protein